MNTPITRAEHEEFVKRMEEEHRRQNRRIELTEESIRQISSIAISVEKLATNMESMLKEQERQGGRIDAMERASGDTWHRIKDKALDTGVGLVFGAFVTGIVLMIAQYIK